MKDIKYKGWTISCWYKPIPMRDFDIDVVHDDYDGAPLESGGPPADGRAFNCASVDEAKERIDNWDIEHE